MSEFIGAEYCEPVEASFSAARRRVLVIEPHADDAILSVDGTMWLQQHECTFVVATVASRSNWSRFRGLDVAATTELRRRESELAARMLGGEHISVGMTEAALRFQMRYPDSEWTDEFYRRHGGAIQASIVRIADDAERARWIEAMRQLLDKERAAEVWIPLGGLHADHMLAADACFAAIATQPSLGHGRVLRVYQEQPYAASNPRHMDAARTALIDAGAVDCLQLDVTRCGGITEFLRGCALAAAHNLQVSGHCAPNLHARAGVAVPNLRHVEYFHDHQRIERMFFDGVLDPHGGVLTPDPGRPGLGLELRTADADPFRHR